MKPNEIIQEQGSTNAPGIYMILCIPSNKAYIGQSKNIHRRWQEHRSHLNKGTHCNTYIQNSFNKYGKESLSFFVLENVGNDLKTREAYWLSLIDVDLRLNLGAISDVIPMSEQTRKKMSECKIGIKRSDEVKSDMSLRRKGKPLSSDTKKKLSDIAKRNGYKPPICKSGRVFSEEHKKKISKFKKEHPIPRGLDGKFVKGAQ